MTAVTVKPSFLGTRRGKLTLALLCAVAFLDFVDGSIVNIALPSIRTDLDATYSSDDADGNNVSYDAEQRTLQLTLKEAVHVTTTAWWASFTPPEPQSTDLEVLDADLNEGFHTIALPSEVPSEASFVAVAVGSAVHVFTVGPMPQSVTRMVPTSGARGSAPQLPPVRAVTTSSPDRQTDA